MAGQVPSSELDAVNHLIRFWRVQPPGGQCQTASKALLWFVSLWVYATIGCLLFGRRDFRTYFQKWKSDAIGNNNLDTHNKGVQGRLYSLGGSLFFQIVATVGTAIIMKDGHG